MIVGLFLRPGWVVATMINITVPQTEKLGIGLGLLMMGMVGLFLVVVVCMGMDWTQ